MTLILSLSVSISNLHHICYIMIQVKIEWVERFQCALSLLGGVGWDGDCFFHRDWWPRHYGFWKVTFTFLLTFFYKHKNAYHCNFCRSSVNWYQEAGSPRCDGGRLVLPEQSSCNSFCLRRVPKQKNPHGSNHFLQAKQHWLHMDNKRRLRSNYICIRTSLMKEKMYYKCDQTVIRK